VPSSRRRSGKECPLILNAINSGDPSTSPPGWSRRYSKGSLPVLRNANRLTVRCRALLCALLRGAKSIPQLDYGEEQAGLETDERFLDQLVSNFETLAHMQRMGVLWGFRLMTLNGQVIESECLGQPVNPPRFSANIGATSVAARSLCTRRPRFRMRSYSVRLRSDCAGQDWELGRRPLWTRTGDGIWR